MREFLGISMSTESGRSFRCVSELILDISESLTGTGSGTPALGGGVTNLVPCTGVCCGELSEEDVSIARDSPTVVPNVPGDRGPSCSLCFGDGERGGLSGSSLKPPSLSLPCSSSFDSGAFDTRDAVIVALVSMGGLREGSGFSTGTLSCKLERAANRCLGESSRESECSDFVSYSSSESLNTGDDGDRERSDIILVVMVGREESWK